MEQQYISIHHILIKNLLYAIYGLVLGYIVIIAIKKIVNKFKIHKYNLPIHILVSVAIISLMEHHLINYISVDPESITSQLFFAGMFFGIQTISLNDQNKEIEDDSYKNNN